MSRAFGNQLTTGGRAFDDQIYTAPVITPEPPAVAPIRGLSLIIHTTPIRQIGRNSAFDLAQPRHAASVTTGPLRSTIGGENDNVTLNFDAGAQLRAALLNANGKRVQLFNAGALEFDGSVNSVRFSGSGVQVSGLA